MMVMMMMMMLMMKKLMMPRVLIHPLPNKASLYW